MFDIGDVVYVVGGSRLEQPAPGYSLAGKTGVVRHLDRNGRVGVEFNESFPQSHNLGGSILSQRGWYIDSSCLQKMRPVKEVIKSHYDLK